MGLTDLLIGEHLMQTAQDVVRAGLLALGSDNRRLFLSHISDFAHCERLRLSYSSP